MDVQKVPKLEIGYCPNSQGCEIILWFAATWLSRLRTPGHPGRSSAPVSLRTEMFPSDLETEQRLVIHKASRMWVSVRCRMTCKCGVDEQVSWRREASRRKSRKSYGQEGGMSKNRITWLHDHVNVSLQLLLLQEIGDRI